MEVTRVLAISASAGRPSATTTRPPAIKNTRHVFSTGFYISNRSCSSLSLSPFLSRMSKTFKGVEGVCYSTLEEGHCLFSIFLLKIGLGLLGKTLLCVNQTRGALRFLKV